MSRMYRANQLHPFLVIGMLAVVVYLILQGSEPDRLGRTVTAAAFVLAVSIQALLLFVQTEFEFDENGFTYRERRLLHVSRLRRVSFSEIERVRIKGRLVRVKIADGEPALVKLGFLPPADRKEVLRMFRKLPQFVEDPFADARTAMAKRDE